MIGAILMAVTSTFAFKPEGKSLMWFSYFSGGTCYINNANTDQALCESYFTGAQCTYLGTPIYYYDVDEMQPPTCNIPLRRFN